MTYMTHGGGGFALEVAVQRASISRTTLVKPTWPTRPKTR
jgi:hypothetical protein